MHDKPPYVRMCMGIMNLILDQSGSCTVVGQPSKNELARSCKIVQESCMQDLLGTCTRYVPFLARFLHNLAPILARSCKKMCKLAGNYSCSISCKILRHFLQDMCKIVQESCKKRDISRARAKQVLHARFLHNLA